jgi:hypothetical protein
MIIGLTSIKTRAEAQIHKTKKASTVAGKLSSLFRGLFLGAEAAEVWGNCLLTRRAPVHFWSQVPAASHEATTSSWSSFSSWPSLLSLPWRCYLLSTADYSKPPEKKDQRIF